MRELPLRLGIFQIVTPTCLPSKARIRCLYESSIVLSKGVRSARVPLMQTPSCTTSGMLRAKAVTERLAVGAACCERTVRMLVHRRTHPLWRRQPDDRGRSAVLPHCPNATFGPGKRDTLFMSSRVRVHFAPYQSTSALRGPPTRAGWVRGVRYEEASSFSLKLRLKLYTGDETAILARRLELRSGGDCSPAIVAKQLGKAAETF